MFAVASAGTICFGVYITLLADELAERTKIGRAMMGALFLGAMTSLAEIGTSLTAAFANHPELAVNNAVGSIAAQTAFIAVADLVYRRANLEHAAASASNLLLVALLLVLITLLILAAVTPRLAFGPFHPASVALVAVYVYGMRMVSHSSNVPMWQARNTDATDPEQSRPEQRGGPLPMIWVRFFLVSVLLGGSGVLLAESGIAIARLTGLSETFVGALLTGVTSSAPELVTAVTAVRIGALTLAIANVIGGNAFDSVIVALSDFAYAESSIYAAAGEMLLPLLVVTLLMNIVVLLGLLRRQKHGFANIGFEGVVLLALYGGIVAYLVA